MTAVAIGQWLVDLAERKLGKGATVRVAQGQWIAERVSATGCFSAQGKTRDVLVQWLERMPDFEKGKK